MKTDNSNTLLSSTHFLLFALFPILFAYACQRTEATTQELLNLKGLKATPNPSVSSFQALLISYTDTVSLGCQRVNSKELAQQPCLANPTQLAPWQTEIPFGSKTRHFKWKVEYMSGTPDCMEHGLMGINGQFPGPTIRARAGDTISVEVTNKLHTEGVVIHWHGITQLGTPIPWADGTASVSQYTINPGETFLYRFKVNKAGSYFYHGHFGMQRSARLCGSLIVDKGDGETEPSHYDGEFNPLLSDSCHQSVHNEEADLSSKPFILQWRKLLNDKELGESKASVHGSGSKTSPSEEDTQDVDKEFGESKASVHGSGSKTSPSEEDTQDVDKELGESKASVHGSGSKTSPFEEDTQDVDKELGESKASVHGSGSKTSPSEEDTQDVDKELGESKASVHGSG